MPESSAVRKRLAASSSSDGGPKAKSRGRKVSRTPVSHLPSGVLAAVTGNLTRSRSCLGSRSSSRS